MKKIFIPLLLVLATLILFGAVGAGAISGLNSEYVSGETIMVTITNSDESSVSATLEANTFDLNEKNVNYKRVYGATSREYNGKKNWTLEIDTADVPMGTYNLIIHGDTKILANDIVKIVSKKTVVQEPGIQKEPIVEPIVEPVTEKKTEPATATSPGFGLIAILGLLPACLLKRK